MRMDMILLPKELLKCIRMALSWSVLSYVLLIPYFTLREVFRRCFGRSRKEAGGEQDGN